MSRGFGPVHATCEPRRERVTYDVVDAGPRPRRQPVDVGAEPRSLRVAEVDDDDGHRRVLTVESASLASRDQDVERHG